MFRCISLSDCLNRAAIFVGNKMCEKRMLITWSAVSWRKQVFEVHFILFAENKFAVGSGAKSVCICYYEQDNNW